MKKYWENDGNANDVGDFVAVIDMEDGTRPSRFIGKSVQEAADKLMDSYGQAVIEMARARSVARASLKPDAPSIDLTDHKPRQLTVDEAFQTTIELQDPATVQKAIGRLVEASVGVPLSRIHDIVGTDRDKEVEKYLGDEATAFAAANPDYYPDPTNVELLFNWLEKRNMQPTRNNLTIAFDDLSNRGILIKAPSGQPSTASQPGTQQPDPNPPANAPNPRSSIRPRYVETSTGLRSSDASATPPAPEKPKKITLAEISAMPREEYDTRLRTDPTFRKAVDALG